VFRGGLRPQRTAGEICGLKALSERRVDTEVGAVVKSDDVFEQADLEDAGLSDLQFPAEDHLVRGL
jgi:hypothetical protein